MAGARGNETGRPRADLLLTGIGQLVTAVPGSRPVGGAAVAVLHGKILAAGPEQEVRKEAVVSQKTRVIDCKGGVVLPGFVDCHTHLVHAGSRAAEHEMRLQGASYLDILKSGGGIHSTVRQTAAASPGVLHTKALADLCEMMRYGTTTAEMKSGYGISEAGEMKLLRVQRRLVGTAPIAATSTHLAHVFPHGTKPGKRAAYLAIQKRLITAAAGNKLASAFDVFCDAGAFTLEESEELLRHAQSSGLAVKLHAEQLTHTGAAELAVSLGALSADHLDHISARGIRALAKRGTVGVVLPGASFHLCERRLPPVRRMLDAGVTLALASDYNPGSSPCKSMQSIIGLACRLYRIPALTAIEMATRGAAQALGLGAGVGTLAPGMRADIALYGVPDHRDLCCSSGTNMAELVIVGGSVEWEKPPH